jgi:hypothetical protein
VTRRVTQGHADKVLEAARTNFSDIFNEAFTKAGWQIVDKPGENVLRVTPGVMNLYLFAPDVQAAGRTTQYVAESGEATLVIEVRDSLTNALLGRFFDRREAGSDMPQMASRVSNTADFRALFRQWSGIAVNGLTVLKEVSPIPQDLKPKQKL